MDFVNLEVNNFNERDKLNSELSSLNMQKADQIELLVSFLFANKDVFHSAYTFDFNSINNISQLNGEFGYWIRSLRDARRNSERTGNLNKILNDFYVKLSDIYNKISETNAKIEQYESEHKVNFSDEELRPSVDYINNITEISNRIGENRNRIAVIVNYIRNIDTEDYMREDHRKMVEALNNQINLDMSEICKLLISRDLSVDNYRTYRNNVKYNLDNMAGSNLTLNSLSYDVMYYEYDNINEMLKNTKRGLEVSNTPEPEVEENSINREEPVPNVEETSNVIDEPVVSEILVEDNSLDSDLESEAPEELSEEEYDNSEEYIPEEGLDDDFDVEEEDEELEREPVDNSPVTQFKDKFKHGVKGISTANDKLKNNIISKVLNKSVLRWIGVVGVLAVAAVINPALLFGGAAIGAGVYEYNIAKKMK